MKESDPLVVVERSSAQAAAKGWAVAAAIVARLHELGVSRGIDVPAVLGPVLSDLSDTELKKLASQIAGPLMDAPGSLLGQYVGGSAADHHRPARLEDSRFAGLLQGAGTAFPRPEGLV